MTVTTKPRVRFEEPRSRVCALALAAALLSVLLVLTGCGSAASSSAKSSKAEESFESSALADTASSSMTSASASSLSSAAAKGDPKLAAQIEKSLIETAETAGMDVGICVIDLGTNTKAGVDEDKQFASASMIKLLIAAAFLEEVESGAYSLDDEHVLQDADVVGGSGTLAGLGVGASVTYRELIEKMISVSDNTAANAIIGEIGMDAINEEADRLGLKETELNRLMMDEEAIAAGRENYTSAENVATLLQLAYEGELVSREASDLVMDALESQEDDEGVLNGLPEGVTFAHKTGALGTVQHDGGIVGGDNPYVLVVLCGGEGFSPQGAYDIMAATAEATWDILGDA